MILFWVIAGLFIAGALLLVLPPLLGGWRKGGPSREAVNVSVYRDQLAELETELAAGTLTREQYEESRAELARRVLEDATGSGESPTPGAQRLKQGRWLAWAAGLVLPVLAVSLYLLLGDPRALAPQQAAVAPEHEGGNITPEQLSAMVDKLAARMQKNPADPQGWILLGRSYMVLGRFAQAAQAYNRATALLPEDSGLWADYADALAMAQGRVLRGEPTKLIDQALKLDPNNPKALALAGSAAFEAKNYQDAIAYWERLLEQLPADSEAARSISSGIREARILAGAGSKALAPSAQASPAIAGVVSVSPKLAARVSASDALFIFAQAPQGPKMPLAVLKLPAGKLPASFSLDDSLSMTPAFKLSDFPEVVVSARISKSGNATPQSGDLQGSARVKLGSRNVKLVIDQVVP